MKVKKAVEHDIDTKKMFATLVGLLERSMSELVALNQKVEQNIHNQKVGTSPNPKGVKKATNGGSNLPTLFSNKEAAEFLGIKAQTLALWRSQGISPSYIKLNNGCIRYPFESLEKFLNEQTISQ